MKKITKLAIRKFTLGLVLILLPAIRLSADTSIPNLLGVWDTSCNYHTGHTNITSQTGASFSGTTLETPLVNGFINGRTVTYTREINSIHQDYIGTLVIDASGTATMTGTFTQNDVGQWDWYAIKHDPIGAVQAPTISSFAPTGGAIGDTITINGTNLLWIFRVSFNGKVSSAVSINSDTSITAKVPEGATTGVITVTSAGGTGTSADNFTVYDPVQLELSVDLGTGYIGAPNQVQLNYVLSGPQEYNGVLPIDGGGMALLTGLQPGTYNLTLSGNHWLKQVLPGLILDGFLHENVALTNGDSNGDNQVNLFDFVVLDSKFGSTFGMADLDGSGTVNLFDYVMIDTNFGALGDL